MMGAFAAYFLLQYSGLGYWWALVIAPLLVGVTGILIERLFLQWLYKLDHLYGLLLTFGLALIIEGVFRNYFGSSGLPYRGAAARCRADRISASCSCRTTAPGWWCFRSRSASPPGSSSSARGSAPICAPPPKIPTLVRAFGINVPRMITLTYGFGVALAALAGVMAAPIYNVSPQMGANLIIVVFAVVVIGGMGSIMGAIVTGFGLGIIEGLTKVFFPEASNTVIFIIMAIVLLIRPAGLFGRSA